MFIHTCQHTCWNVYVLQHGIHFTDARQPDNPIINSKMDFLKSVRLFKSLLISLILFIISFSLNTPWCSCADVCSGARGSLSPRVFLGLFVNISNLLPPFSFTTCNTSTLFGFICSFSHLFFFLGFLWSVFRFSNFVFCFLVWFLISVHCVHHWDALKATSRQFIER